MISQFMFIFHSFLYIFLFLFLITFSFYSLLFWVYSIKKYIKCLDKDYKKIVNDILYLLFPLILQFSLLSILIKYYPTSYILHSIYIFIKKFNLNKGIFGDLISTIIFFQLIIVIFILWFQIKQKNKYYELYIKNSDTNLLKRYCFWSLSIINFSIISIFLLISYFKKYSPLDIIFATDLYSFIVFIFLITFNGLYKPYYNTFYIGNYKINTKWLLPIGVFIWIVSPLIVGLFILIFWGIFVLYNIVKSEEKDIFFKRSSLNQHISVSKYLIILIILSLLGIFLLGDLIWGVSAYTLFIVFYCLIGILIVKLLGFSASKKYQIVIVFVFLISIFLISKIGWGPRNVFIKTLFHIKNGMSIDHVENIMKKYKKYPEKFENSNKNISYREIVYTCPTNDAGSQEFGVIKLSNGKVTKVYFEYD